MEHFDSTLWKNKKLCRELILVDLMRGKMTKALTSLQGTFLPFPFSDINPFYFPSLSDACNAGKD